MEIELNGSAREIAPGSTIATLVEELGLGRFSFAVERNRVVVPRSEHESTLLEPGDAVEVVTFVGGG